MKGLEAHQFFVALLFTELYYDCAPFRSICTHLNIRQEQVQIIFSNHDIGKTVNLNTITSLDLSIQELNLARLSIGNKQSIHCTKDDIVKRLKTSRDIVKYNIAFILPTVTFKYHLNLEYAAYAIFTACTHMNYIDIDKTNDEQYKNNIILLSDILYFELPNIFKTSWDSLPSGPTKFFYLLSLPDESTWPDYSVFRNRSRFIAETCHILDGIAAACADNDTHYNNNDTFNNLSRKSFDNYIEKSKNIPEPNSLLYIITEYIKVLTNKKIKIFKAILSLEFI